MYAGCKLLFHQKCTDRDDDLTSGMHGSTLRKWQCKGLQHLARKVDHFVNSSELDINAIPDEEVARLRPALQVECDGITIVAAVGDVPAATRWDDF